MNLQFERLCRVCLQNVKPTNDLFPLDFEVTEGHTIRTIISNSVEMTISDRFGVKNQLCEECLKHFLVANKIKCKLFKAEEFFNNFPMTKKKNDVDEKKSKKDDSKPEKPCEKIDNSSQTEEITLVEERVPSQSKTITELSDEMQFILVSSDSSFDLEVVEMNESEKSNATAMTLTKTLSKNTDTEVEKHFDCKDCSRNFSSKKELLTHQELFHSDNIVRRCDICFREYTLKSKLKKHRKSKHPTCSICCRTFVSKSSFKRHQNFVHKDMD